jgi:hypothetical protein
MSNDETHSWAEFFAKLEQAPKMKRKFWTQSFPSKNQDEQDEILLAYESWKAAEGPQTDDELHAFILEHYGMNIPRVAVCADHQAPFKAFSDLYFERVLSAVWMTNRGGSKTQMAALWHLLSAKFKGVDGISIGAILEHAGRCYDRLIELIRKDGKVNHEEEHPDIVKSLQSETIWANGAKVEIVPGTEAAVNGPHHPHCHVDEQELMKPNVFQESRNISLSKDGNAAQDLITSTRKRAHGQMQNLLNEIKEAERAGFDPPYELYTWCIFECAQNQAHCCQVADPELPAEQRCNCDRIVKGKWESGEARTFKDVCQGRLARSGGWLPLSDLHKTFRTTTKDVWESQQECSRPSSSGLRLPEFERARAGIRHWRPDPTFGPIYGSVDFGGTNPHAVEFMQVLNQPVAAYGFHSTDSEEANMILPEGSHIVFDEIYKAQIAPSKLADMTLARVAFWRNMFPEFRIQRFFYDVQGKAAALEWRAHDPPIPLVNYATKDVDLHTSYWKGLLEDDQFYVDITRCPMLADEIEAWHNPDQKPGQVDSPDKPVKDFDHAVDATRYMIANVRSIKRSRQLAAAPTGTGESGYGGGSSTGAGPSRYLPSSGNPIDHIRFPRPDGWPGT